jgi:hypothetical protein
MLKIKFKIALAASLLFLPLCALHAIEYAYANPEPQKTGWPVTPAAGYRGMDVGVTHWLDIHAKLVADVQAHKGSTDILILGDSITKNMGGSAINGLPLIAPWQKHFGHLKTVNAGLAGDHLDDDGYEIYAAKLTPFVDGISATSK